MSYQPAKATVLEHYRSLDSSDDNTIAAALQAGVTSAYRWRGFHPFGELIGAETVAERFWQPLRRALSPLQRRMDVFFAGHNRLNDDGTVWVCSMGHLMGLFVAPWLGIRPSGKLTLLRYGAFHKVVGDKIAETALYIDIPHLMIQAGQDPFPPQTGAHLVQPGPAPHDGLLFEDRPAAEGTATQAAIDRMLTDLAQWDSGLPLEEELRRSWHEDMLWWGPAGIGATYTIPAYARQHAGPFRAGFAERSPTRHLCRIAEGQYGGFFGWPNFTARPIGGFMGMPGTDKAGPFRVIDIYRRAGDKLAENWIFIDLLHFWNELGVDILGRTCPAGPDGHSPA